MKKLASFFLVSVLTLFSLQSWAVPQQYHTGGAQNKEARAQGTVTLHFFWSQDCPHCEAAHPFIDKLKAEYPWLVVKQYEISGSVRNTQLFDKMAREHGRETSFVPTFFVGDKMIVGYTNAQTTGAEIREAVNAYHKNR